ncbi:uncharacterized protein L3040_006226 [Drepanopeziza brunnea f. sp. 'multigermtubi']|nr:hypothetical protein L3040_006226 [Drepanopeziza brunnea f. sp. 'multigermtubi']
MLQREDVPPGSSFTAADTMDDDIAFAGENFVNDDLDDVFGSAPPSPSHPAAAQGNFEPSDIPRLREKHETEGYRDGVTKGKGESVQAGFDEGYALGAVLGLRIGKILGMLEGILAGVKGKEIGKEMEAERVRVERQFDEARGELRTEVVFGREFWGEDGVWRFEVPGDGKEGSEVVFSDVAGAHPLVRKWEGLVAEEVRRWGLDLGILDGEGGEEEVMGEKKKGAMSKTVGKGEMESEAVAAGMAKAMGIQKKDLAW